MAGSCAPAISDGLSRAMKQAARLDGDEWASMSRRARASVADHALSIGAARLLQGVEQAMAQSRELQLAVCGIAGILQDTGRAR